MKKVTKVLLAILLLVVIAAGAVLYWQKGNIAALINGTKYSSEDLASQLDSNRDDLKDQVEKYTTSTINDLSSKDEQKLLNGEITIEEISDKYNLPLDVMKEDFSYIVSADSNAVSSPNTDNSKEIDKAISTGVSNLYALKAKYVAKLGELERSVYNEYTKLPKEKQTEDSKKDIVMKNINKISEMEQKCDQDVDEVLSILEAELIKLKGDTEIIKILKDSYANEKEIKKSYYLSLYNNKQ